LGSWVLRRFTTSESLLSRCSGANCSRIVHAAAAPSVPARRPCRLRKGCAASARSRPRQAGPYAPHTEILLVGLCSGCSSGSARRDTVCASLVATRRLDSPLGCQ
jgi:hypothetical protein